MAEVERDAAPRSARELLLPPPGYLGDELEHATHSGGVKREPWRRRLLPCCERRIGHRCVCEQIQPELHGVLASGVRQFIEERLEGERQSVALWRAEGAR